MVIHIIVSGMHGHKTSHLPIRYFLASLWAHPILHISTIRVKCKLTQACFLHQEGNSNKALVFVLPKYLLYFQFPIFSMERLWILNSIERWQSLVSHTVGRGGETVKILMETKLLAPEEFQAEDERAILLFRCQTALWEGLQFVACWNPHHVRPPARKLALRQSL